VLESLRDLDLQIGSILSFGPSEHQASHKVWGTVLDEEGAFRPLDLE
jgi:branched-chain amino acid transport system substrate-binding protein